MHRLSRLSARTSTYTPRRVQLSAALSTAAAPSVASARVLYQQQMDADAAAAAAAAKVAAVEIDAAAAAADAMSPVRSVRYRALSGVFAVYKPRGVTSRTLLNALAVRLSADPGAGAAGSSAFEVTQRQRLKTGHGGTLDKAAEGLMVVATGHGTKLLSTYLAGDKQYAVAGLLGVSTDTLDLDEESVVTRHQRGAAGVHRKSSSNSSRTLMLPRWHPCRLQHHPAQQQRMRSLRRPPPPPP